MIYDKLKHYGHIVTLHSTQAERDDNGDHTRGKLFQSQIHGNLGT